MYQQGNIIFTPDGNSVLSPVGNRVSVFDLVKSVLVQDWSCAGNKLTSPFDSNKSFTFAFQNRKNIAAIALSPQGNILISVDEGAPKALFNFFQSSSTYTPRRNRRQSPPRQLPPGRRHPPFQFQKASQRHRIFAKWIIHRCDARIAYPSLEDSEPPCSRVCAVQSASNVYRTS